MNSLTDLWIAILKVNGTQFRVVVVSVPATVETCVGVGIVNPIVRLVVDKPPLDIDSGWVGTSFRCNPLGRDCRAQRAFHNCVGLVTDLSGSRMPAEYIVQTPVDSGVDGATKAHVSRWCAAVVYEIVLRQRRLDEFDPVGEVVPLAGYLATARDLLGVVE